MRREPEPRTLPEPDDGRVNVREQPEETENVNLLELHPLATRSTALCKTSLVRTYVPLPDQLYAHAPNTTLRWQSAVQKAHFRHSDAQDMNEVPLTDIARFIPAQGAVYREVLAQLRAGRKTGHWMWFVFPQLVALGRSETARFYGLADRDEAQRYWEHPVLGTRLEECCRILLTLEHRSAAEIFGSPDDLKLRSCMTLFEVAVPAEPIFGEVLLQFCSGERDTLTLSLVEQSS